jgi:MinD-like ATPase involved in chromosome partitioning or flagellar assembly
MTGGRLAAGLRTLFGSTAGAAYELTTADETVRTGLSLSRRIGVVALDGGSGTTAVAVALSSLLAARRPGPVLAVDAAGGHAGLIGRTVGEDPALRATSAAGADHRWTASTGSQARSGLPQSGSGPYVLDLAGTARVPSAVDTWVQEVTPIARFFDVVVTDWGARGVGLDFAESVTTGHLLVMVSRADRHSATRAAAAAAAVGQLKGAPGGATRGAGDRVPTVLVLVDVSRTADRVAPALRRRLGTPVHVLPHDLAWSADPMTPGRRFDARTRRAHICLAQAVMGQAARSQEPVARTTPTQTTPTQTTPTQTTRTQTTPTQTTRTPRPEAVVAG